LYSFEFAWQLFIFASRIERRTNLSSLLKSLKEKKTPKGDHLNLRVPAEVKEKLKGLAGQEGITVTELILKILNSQLPASTETSNIPDAARLGKRKGQPAITYVRLHPTIRRLVDQLAMEKFITRSAVIRQAVLDYLKAAGKLSTPDNAKK